jgi:hypothetical protein
MVFYITFDRGPVRETAIERGGSLVTATGGKQRRYYCLAGWQRRRMAELLDGVRNLPRYTVGHRYRAREFQRLDVRWRTHFHRVEGTPDGKTLPKPARALIRHLIRLRAKYRPVGRRLGASARADCDAEGDDD